MTVTLEEAGPRFQELVRVAQSGDEIVIVEAGKEVARLSAPMLSANGAEANNVRFREPGSAIGKAEFYMSGDFDAPLDDFKDYM